MPDPIDALKDAMFQALQDRDGQREYLLGALIRFRDQLKEGAALQDWARIWRVIGTIESLFVTEAERIGRAPRNPGIARSREPRHVHDDDCRSYGCPNGEGRR